MNRIYKVIWNEALSCFTAVGEYAKGRGKSSKSSVSANATINTTSNLSSIHTLRLSAIGLGLLAAGFGMQANADVSYSNTMHIMGHQSSGSGYGHESHGNGHGHNNNGNGLKFDGDTGKTVKRSHGQTLTIKGGEANKKKLSNGDNIGVVADGKDTLTIKLAKNLTDLDSAAFNGGVAISAMGINAGHKKIVNVDSGLISASSKEAVNGSQLHSLSNTVAANKTKYYSVNSTAGGNANNDGATGPNAMAMGGNATATGGQAIAIGSGQSGQHTTASGQQSIAIGANVVSKGHSSIALGGDDLDDASKANIGSSSTSSALNGGTVNTIFKHYAGKDMVEANRYDVNTESSGAASIALGVKTQSKGDLSTAVGVHATSAGTASSAFGMASAASGKGALALGAGAQSATQNGVALGSTSIANVAGGAAGFVPVGTSSIDKHAIMATKSVTLGAVSVGTGSEGGNRQIVNVAAGTSNSDAVNVAQLKGLQNGINSTFDQGMDFGGDSGIKVNRKIGEQLLIQGGETDSTKLSNSNNIGVVANGSDTLTLKLAKNVTGLDSVSAGASLLNTNGLTITGGPKFTATGINANHQQITGVASGGTTVSNAANIGDLNKAITDVSDLGFALKAADGNTVQKPLGQAVEVVGSNNNIDTRVNNGKIEVELNDNLDLGHYGSVKMGSSSPFGLGPVTTVNKLGLKTGNALLNTTVSGLGIAVSSPLSTTLISSNGVNIIGGPSITKSGGVNAGNKKVVNVDNGDVTATSKDAINGSQLFDTNNEIAKGIKFNVDGLERTYALGDTIGVTTDDNIDATETTDGAKFSLANVVNIGTVSPVQINGTAGTISGLTNTNFDPNIAYTGGQAATQEQLNDLNNGINTTVNQGLNFGGDTGNPINRKLGEQLLIQGGETDSAKLSNSNNIGVVADGTDTLTLKLAKDVAGLDSVITGHTLLNTAGVSFLGSSTVSLSNSGLNNGGNRITNVNDGEEPMDAVNVRQLAGVTETANRGWDISAQGNSATKSTVGPGDTVDFNSKNSNITVSKDTTSNDVSFELSDNLDLGHYGRVKMGSSSPFGLGPVTTVNKLGLKTGNALLNTTVSGLGIAVSSPLSTTLISSDGVNIIGGPSVTKSGGIDAANKKITNVEAGTTTLDAVNFGQLEDVSNVADSAIQNVITQIDSTDVKTLNKTDNTANFLTGDNIVLTAENGGIKVATADEVVFTSVTTGDTLLNTAGVSFLGGSTVRLSSNGLNNGGNRITNVADGSALDDAVNVSQLNSSSAAAKTEVAAGTNMADVMKSTGQNGQDVYTVNANGVTTSAGSTAVTVIAGDKDMASNTTDYAVDLSEASKASLVKADSAMQTVITQIDGTEVKTLNQTDNTANFLTGDNIVLSAEDGGIKVATAENVTFTSVITGDTLLNTAGVSFLGGSTVRLSSSGLNNGGNKITNVDDGEEDTDAVNVRQLNATNSTVDLGLNFTGDDTDVVVNRKLGQTLTIQGGATEVTENNIGVIADDEGNLNVRLAEDVVLGKNGSVRMESTVLNNAGITITDGPNQTITLSNEGLDNGNNRIIKVAEGIAPSDAVNFAQLTTTNNEIAKGIKIGDGNSDNDQQFVLGDTINVTGDSNLTTVASETGVQVKLNNQLDLGDTGSMQIGNSIMNNAGVNFLGGSTVKLSSSGLNNGGNRITNVADGSALDDAVTVSQLNDVTETVNQGWDISAQGNSNTVSNVGPGGTVDFSSKNGNIIVTKEATSNDVSFELNDNLDLNSVTTGDTTMNDNGLIIAGGPSVTKSGIDAANKKVTNVQNGEIAAGSQDAINGSQLYAQGSGISSIIGGDTVYDSESGTFTNSNIGGTGEGNIDGAIASIRQGTIEINENVQVNTTNIATNTTNISTNTNDIATNTSSITTNTNDIATNTSSITTNTNDIAINTSNIMTNTTNIKTNTDKLDAGLNFGADSGANINKPVGDGSVLSFTGGNNITTTAEGSSIKFDLNGNISVDSVTVGTTVINSSGISMQDGPSMTAQGLYAGNQRITGVADGVEATDAVNYSQLSELDSRLNNNMSDLGYKIGEVEENANAGISAAMAMSSLPQAYIAGKSMISGGVGTYNGESAVAVGFSKLSNDGRWVMKINGTADTQGNAGGAIGAGFHFD